MQQNSFQNDGLSKPTIPTQNLQPQTNQQNNTQTPNNQTNIRPTPVTPPTIIPSTNQPPTNQSSTVQPNNNNSQSPTIQPTPIQPTPIQPTPIQPTPIQPTQQILNPQRFSALKGYKIINDNIVDLIKAVQIGPVIVAHYVSNAFKFYSNGIFDGEGCEDIETVNHAVLLVGYNLTAETPYLILKNSWGKLWGEDGYYKLEIGPLLETNKGKCLIAGTPFNVIPILNQIMNNLQWQKKSINSSPEKN